MRTRTSCVAVALLMGSVSAGAQTVLSEAEALARLSPDSPRVRAIRSGVELARADVLAASRWPNPRATFNRESVAGVTENMVTVTQPLPITGRRGFDINAASALVEASARRADEELRRAKTELRAAYADLVFAQVKEVEAARARDRARELAEVLARRETAGDAAGYDRLRVEREVTELDGEVAAARADKLRAQAVLGSFLADVSDPTRIVAVLPENTTRAPLPGAEELLQRAETTRGDFAALQLDIASARFAEQAAGRRFVLEPELVVGTKSSNAAGGDLGSVISVHAAIPLFDRLQPERAMSRARVSQAEARIASLRIAVTAQVAALRSLVEERRDSAERYRATSMTSASQLERIAQVSYDAGERGILELLDAYRSTASSRARQASLDAAVRQAEIELEFVSGWEMP